jgi:signal transduction histidine kinase
MKFILQLYFFFFCLVGWAQHSVDQPLLKNLQNCKTEKCRIKQSFLLAEYFLETDDIESSQRWLEKTKDLVSPKVIDSTAVFIQSLQSELFYYMGLYQFGTNEAEKAKEKAKQIKDSLLIADAYFFLGINQLEINELEKAQQSLWKSRNYFPKKTDRKHIRSLIQKEHIYNNIAQSKFKLKEMDSAVWYNAKAYTFAKKNNSKRGIPNIEQTFGQIYLSKNQKDSALFYFQKSIHSAINSNYYDIVLLNFSYLMESQSDDQVLVNQWFEKGMGLMDQKTINITFQRYFYVTALAVFKKMNQTDKVAFVQEKIIAIDDETQLKGNYYIQNITEQYAKNENKLLTFQVEELTKQRKYAFLQLIAAGLSLIILSLGIVIIRRKNKIQQTLLDQKNEISKDLHDDIGSGLSSILIHADLLLKNGTSDEKQKVLASKINQTGKEISQRLNAFIWSLNTEHNTLQHFCEYTKQYGANLFEETPISFVFQNSIKNKETIKMNGQQRKNLFYALKEILNNTLKHAQATKVVLQISLEANKQLQFTIQDNGTGITKANAFGNGFKNIQNRVEDLKGTFSVKTDNGLLTIITIPL